jgi:hypothetical protein
VAACTRCSHADRASRGRSGFPYRTQAATPATLRDTRADTKAGRLSGGRERPEIRQRYAFARPRRSGVMLGHAGCPPLPREQERALARFLQALTEASGGMRSSAGEDPRHRNATVAIVASTASSCLLGATELCAPHNRRLLTDDRRLAVRRFPNARSPTGGLRRRTMVARPIAKRERDRRTLGRTDRGLSDTTSAAPIGIGWRMFTSRRLVLIILLEATPPPA